ncbi:hypothetical protein ACFSDA_14315 [Brachybacterium rhamnosum]|uniref:Uncharacterized protein n=1 Tax=Brachybacterium rhamnosum TaxID=173361 RepID=A0ABW4Q3E5_9MICO
MRQQTTVLVSRGTLLNANDRRHWGAGHARTSQLRMIGKGAGRAMYPVPAGVRVRVDVDVWKGYTSHYDPANLYPTAKALVDGLRDARVLTDDDWKHVDGPHLHHGGVDPSLRGRIPAGDKVRFVVTLDSIGGAL